MRFICTQLLPQPSAVQMAAAAGAQPYLRHLWEEADGHGQRQGKGGQAHGAVDGQHQSAVAPQELQPAQAREGEMKGKTLALCVCVDASLVTGASYFWSWKRRKRVWIWRGSSFCFVLHFYAGSANHPESVIRI